MNDEADAETRHRFLSIIEREARRMQQLVIDLLSISRVEADRFRRPTAPADLAALVRTTIAQLRDSEQARAKDTLAKLDNGVQPVRKSDVVGQRVNGRVDHGGSRRI